MEISKHHNNISSLLKIVLYYSNNVKYLSNTNKRLRKFPVNSFNNPDDWKSLTKSPAAFGLNAQTFCTSFMLINGCSNK